MHFLFLFLYLIHLIHIYLSTNIWKWINIYTYYRYISSYISPWDFSWSPLDAHGETCLHPYHQEKSHGHHVMLMVKYAIAVPSWKIGNDPVFSMIMRLATEHEYCTGLICYSNPIFSIDKGMLILKLLKYKYELKPMFIISCMPDKQNYISIYHGSQATLTNDTLSFNQELPSLTIMQLKNTTAVSFKMRSIKDSDLIDSNILPIYHQDKIAFLCVKKATTIVVNSKPMICNEFTLQFQNIPKQLVHNNKSVIIRSREHTFITNIDLKSKDIFVENYKLQSIDVDHWTKISNTFRQMEPIHYAFGTVVFLIILVMSCFFIVICYIRVPSILSALTCNLCCKDKLLTRKQYLLNKKRLETHDRTRVKFSELKVTDDEQLPTSQP